MTRKNPYEKGTKLSKYKTEKIIKCFALDITANKTAEVLGIERKTINRKKKQCIVYTLFSFLIIQILLFSVRLIFIFFI